MSKFALGKTALSVSAEPARQATIINAGPGVVYYDNERTVSATSNDGELAANESLTFSEGVRWIISASASRIFVTYSPTASTDMATQAELDAVSTDGASTAELEAHESDTTNIHGIADTSKLAEDADVTAEEAARKAADEAQDEATEASGKGYVNHGETASTARPTGYASVEWYGSVEPENALDGDTWVVEV